MNTGRLGVFVSGFRWSGSSAVSDWLYGYAELTKPVASDAAFGEVRALNYGVQALLQIVEDRIIFGERLARWALYPDPRGWAGIFGKSLYRARGIRGKAHRLIDSAILAALKGRLRPRLEFYRPMLDDHLRCDALADPRYLELLRALMEALQRSVDDRKDSVDENPDVAAAVSGLFSLFYDRLAGDSAIPVFDNAIAGMNARYYRLFTPGSFDRQIIYLVYRDPRDQFAEQVRHSVRTTPGVVGGFIRDYRTNLTNARSLVDHFRDDPTKIVRVISFEEFVCSAECRERLADEAGGLLVEFGFSAAHVAGDFDPVQSRRNIGLWQHARLNRQMRRITAELPEFLRPEADSC